MDTSNTNQNSFPVALEQVDTTPKALITETSDISVENDIKTQTLFSKSSTALAAKRYASFKSNSLVHRSKDEKSIFTILIDSTVIGSLSNHCFGDRHVPVYGLLMGVVFEEEKAAHICGFVPCERDVASLSEKRLIVSSESKNLAFEKISSMSSYCIGSYCSDFSAIASFGSDLLLPADKAISTHLLLRIFVNNKVGTLLNENGNFLSSLSAFVIRKGMLSTSYRVHIRIRDIIFTPQLSFSSTEHCLQAMLAENKHYFDSLLCSSSTHPGDKYILASEFDKYLLTLLQNDLVPQFNHLESEMKRISSLKHILKAALQNRFNSRRSGQSKEKFDSFISIITKSIDEFVLREENIVDGGIHDWEMFKEYFIMQSHSTSSTGLQEEAKDSNINTSSQGSLKQTGKTSLSSSLTEKRKLQNLTKGQGTDALANGPTLSIRTEPFSHNSSLPTKIETLHESVNDNAVNSIIEPAFCNEHKVAHIDPKEISINDKCIEEPIATSDHPIIEQPVIFNCKNGDKDKNSSSIS